MVGPFLESIRDGRWNSAFFDTNGDESGSICMNVNGSITPVDFTITAPPGHTWFIHCMVGFSLFDGDAGPSMYAGLPELQTGLELWARESGVDRLMTNQHTLKKDADWAAYTSDVHYMLPVCSQGGKGRRHGNTPQTALTWRFQMTDDGAPYRLMTGDSLTWRINDDLSELVCAHVRAGMVSTPNDYV